jgi:hypothetical protein
MHYSTRYSCFHLLSLVALIGPSSLPGFARAEGPPPSVLKGTLVGTSVSATPISGLVMGKLKVVFGTSKLMEVGAPFMNMLASHSGQASTGVTWLCFTVEAPHETQRLWLLSDDEYGGTDLFVTGAYAKKVRPTSARPAECPSISLPDASVIFDGGIGVGSTLANAKTSLHEVGLQPNGWWRFEYMGKESQDVRGTQYEFDVSGWADLRLSNGIVTAIHATKILSD